MIRQFAFCLVVLLVVCLSYVGYREYQQHIEFKEFVAKATSVPVAELSPPKVVSARPPAPPAVDLNAAANFINHQTPGRTITTASGEKIKISLSEFEIGKELIHVLPNGEMYSVYAPEDSLDKPTAWVIKPYEGTLEGLDNLPAPENPQGDTSPIVYHKDDVPAGEDPYIYGVKLMKAQAMGLSIEAFEEKLANREIIIGSSYRVPLKPQMERRSAEIRSSEYSPNSPSESVPMEGANSERSFDEETIPVGSDDRAFPSDLSGTVESTPSPQSVAGIEKQLTPEGIESDLTKGLSADKFDKVQQLIDQYSTEEGLRRLQESDPEAARQFERERRPVPSRDVQDGRQPESGSKD